MKFILQWGYAEMGGGGSALSEKKRIRNRQSGRLPDAQGGDTWVVGVGTIFRRGKEGGEEGNQR